MPEKPGQGRVTGDAFATFDLLLADAWIIGKLSQTTTTSFMARTCNLRAAILSTSLLGTVLLPGCATEQPAVDSVVSVTSAINAPGSAQSLEVVDCLLPGQIRQLGTQIIYVTERRPVRTTAEDCAIRGGEYAAGDRADYGTALKVWLEAAQKGEAEAQYYTGTLYEKGAGGPPDYRQAADWYRKAAEQGDGRAAISLGRLHEQGLGMSRDSAEALKWFARASGLSESNLSLLANSQMNRQIHSLRQQLAGKSEEAEKLRHTLNASQAELTKTREELKDRKRLATEEQRKIQEAEQRYQAAQAQLELLRKQPNQSTATATYEASAKKLQQEMAQAKHALDDRNKEASQLQQKITALESDARQHAKDLQTASAEDMGFDGPSLEIIDPPLAKTRGIQVSTDELAILVSTGARRSVTGRVLAPAGLRALTVNGESMKANEDGVFTATLPALRSGTDVMAVQILAVDTQNKRAALKFMLKARGTMEARPQATKQNISDFGRYHALVIGNDHYTHWPELMNAISDATVIAKVLKEQYGFQVTLLKDASRAHIMKALNQYRQILTEQDNLLIYYAGHGHLEEGIDRGYWIPVDAEIDDNSEWVLLPAVTDMLQLISAKHVMVVADSCFSGKLTRSSLAQLKPGLTDDARFDLLKTLAQKRVRTAMTSGGVKPVLDAGGSGHSVFAEAFLGVLEENTIILEAERLFWAVRTRVVSTSQKMNAEQIPTYDPIHMAGHETIGDFIFVPRAL